MIPTLLPEGIRYADVYVGPNMIICYNYHATEDFRFANVSIEISLSHHRVPTPEEMRNFLMPGNELIQIGDKWVVISPNALDNWNGEVVPLGGLHYNGLSYGVSVRRPLTTQDLIKIIESMKIPD